ncbi:MAG TPA: S-layer homology domain-containing protein [Candidatus Limnocylindrales bacterium]|nr:S-layer homology domain-containing protein [Candidatus Limnocylindrales bacterium]
MRSTRARVLFGLAFIGATLAPSQPVARGAHPGADGGLTYPVTAGIRVHAITANTLYDLALPGARDVAWTPDGRFVAYSVPEGDAPGLYVADSAGCDVERVTTDAADRAPNFDGQALYFTRDETTFTLDYDWDAETSPVTGTPEVWATDTTDVAVSVLEARWAYVEPPAETHPDEHVLLLDDIFARHSTVEVFRSPDPIGGIEWSPDGSILAFEASPLDGGVQVFVADVTADPIEPEQMTDGSQDASSPAFSPDGDTLAYLRGSAIVRLLDLATGDDVFLSQQAKGNLDWQPIVVPAAVRPTETSTSVTLDEPSAGPGLHAFTVTVDPAPAEGSVAVTIDGAEPYPVELEADTGIVQDVATLDVGSHTIGAEFLGSCPHLASGGQLTAEVPPPPAFSDIADSPFRDEIGWLVGAGITNGCAPDLFCPNDEVTREQMASFIARALDLPDASTDYFVDDDESTHEGDINRLALAEISLGCTPQYFCPNRPVTRQEMASFLARALELAATSVDYFTDDDGRTHEPDINRIAEAGITTGCGPGRFCPVRIVTREEMAAFLYRALN